MTREEQESDLIEARRRLVVEAYKFLQGLGELIEWRNELAKKIEKEEENG